jgi:hypothetical protein
VNVNYCTDIEVGDLHMFPLNSPSGGSINLKVFTNTVRTPELDMNKSYREPVTTIKKIVNRVFVRSFIHSFIRSLISSY